MHCNNVFQYSKIKTRKRNAKKSIKKVKNWNPALFGIRNPLCWNPESGIQYSESGIHSVESRIQEWIPLHGANISTLPQEGKDLAHSSQRCLSGYLWQGRCTRGRNSKRNRKFNCQHFYQRRTTTARL